MAKTLRVGLLTAVDRLDPRQPPEFVGSSLLLQVFEPPFSLPLEGRPSEPLLFAAPLQQEPDAGGRMVWSGALRPGVTFSDGTPVTAEHVVQSLAATRALAGQATAEARGGRVVFTLDRPNARFHLALTQSGCGVFLEKGGRLLGSGPFAVAPDSSPTRVRLVRNERYREKVALDAVEYRTYWVDAQGKPSALLAAIEGGEVDLCYVLGRDDVSRLTKVRKYILPGASTCLLYLNTRSAQLSDVKVRRALAHAVDRQALTKLSYTNSLAFTAQSPLPPALGGGRDGLDHDEGKARELLAAAARKPARLSMLRVWGPRPYLPDPVRLAESLVETFGRLGIRVDVSPTRDPADYFRQIAAGGHDLYLSGWAADTPDPADYLEAVLGSRAVPRPGSLAANGNLARYESPAMDQALERYRADPQEARWREVLALLREDAPLVPIQYGAVVQVHSFQVTRFTPSAFGRVPLGEVDLRE